MQRKPLFISFTGLLCQLKEEKVSQWHLNRGLFYFGCTRPYVFQPTKEIEEIQSIYHNHPKEGRNIHQTIKDAIERAEQKGRVAFRPNGQGNTFTQLNQLLADNSVDIAPVKHMKDLSSSCYTYHAIEKNYSRIADVRY